MANSEDVRAFKHMIATQPGWKVLEAEIRRNVENLEAKILSPGTSVSEIQVQNARVTRMALLSVLSGEIVYASSDEVEEE